MQNKTSSSVVLGILALLFIGLVLVNNHLFKSVRIDLTEDQVYSLSDGSKQILEQIEEPLHLYFFFSDKATEGMTSLRNYASRVQSLLEEYASAADGNIVLHVIDPEPFSDAEDQANEFGLTAASAGVGGDNIYLGLAARNALDDEKVIGFFDPKQEAFLEYEISKAIYQLTNPEPVHVTLLTDLNIEGGQNPMSGQFEPPWTFYTQLQQLYEVEKIGSDAQALPDSTDVLILLHPTDYSEALLYAIDQYAMAGGKLLVFVDPHHESDPMAAMDMSANSSELGNLLSAWGVEYAANNVVLDVASGLEVRTPQGGVARHLGILGLGQAELDEDDVVTAGLEVINGASFGFLQASEGAASQFIPLLWSSEHSDVVDVQAYAAMREPEQLARQFKDSLQAKVLAARVAGAATSAFDEALGESANAHIAQTSSLNLIVVADSDLLSDRFWVQQTNFFGQTIATPFANNGDWITNAVENLGGNNALISIRSRGSFVRPFVKVDEIRVLAEEKFREQEQLLQQQLNNTEAQLAELQNQQGEGGALILNEAQQQAIDEFVERKVEIRRALREVRHQLDKDIENLGSWLKFINIALMPLLLVGGLFLLGRKLRLKQL